MDFWHLQIVKNTDFEKPLDRVYWKALDELFVGHVVEKRQLTFCDFGTLKINKNTDFEKPLDQVT